MTSQLHRKLVQESPDIATIIDTDGTITYVSPSVQRTLGYDPEEIVGEVGYEYQHPDDRDSVAEAIEHVVANPDETQTVQTRFRHADGSWMWVEASLQNRLDDPDIDGILVNSRNISAQKEREQQYREVAEEAKTLLETVQDSIFFLTVESTASGYEFQFERLNQAYEEQTGLTTEDVRGKTPTEVFGDDLGSELQANYHRCVRAREPITYQEEVPVETGERFWHTNLAPVITNGEVTRIIGITRNITERVKRERQLQSKNEQLDEFASVVSHDLRNPLNVAQSRAELLADECESEHIAPVRRALDRMEELVSDTLTLARHGKVVADPEPVELTTLVDTCWNSVSTGDATIEINDQVTLSGDRSQLQHVFENLFRNAVEHSSTNPDSQTRQDAVEHSSTGSQSGTDDAVEHGGPAVTVRVGQIGDHGLYVEDTGPGIPEDQREAVFEPGHTSTTDGTGFGLAIVRRIAEAHGWGVSIVDGPDGGTRFEFNDVEFE